jgi:hypothetical protein
MADDLREDVLAFIRTTVKSVWSLELLLLLRRGAGRAWSADDLVREIRGSRAIVSQAVSGFIQAGLVRQEDSKFWYGPAIPELDRLVEDLGTAYADRPTTVVNAILTAPRDQLLQDFADAFKIKKDD